MNHPSIYLFTPTRDFVRFKHMDHRTNHVFLKLQSYGITAFVDADQPCDFNFFHDTNGLFWFVDNQGVERLETSFDFNIQHDHGVTILGVHNYRKGLSNHSLRAIRSMFSFIYLDTSFPAVLTREMERLVKDGCTRGVTVLKDIEKNKYDTPSGDLDLLLNFSKYYK